MNHLFQVTVYTGQQLVLEALQRWLQRPCAEPEVQRQRRTSIRGLIVLLLKTAATGVLATVLDAAIEYRRRQLLAAAESASSSDESRGRLASFVSLGPLSRAGIAAWKSRLLLAIDEMERQAEHYGIEPTHRFGPGKGEAPPGAAASKGKGTSTADAVTPESDPTRQAALSATVDQLRELAGKPEDEDASRRLNEGVDLLLDVICGAAPCEPRHAVLSASASCSNMPGLGAGSDACDPGSPPPEALCHICMDRQVRVQVAGCSHALCFQCSRRLCAVCDHTVPQCPFCRQTIKGFSPFVAAARA